jgi:A/G-specific adenine glycosylase
MKNLAFFLLQFPAYDAIGDTEARETEMKPASFDHAALLAWYRANRREMPWRGHPSPYAVWVSEIMLQQTQVDTVRPYFARFIAQFPTVRALARAEAEPVLKAWEGLGYYARARNLQRAAQRVVAEHHGRIPETAAELAALPGIGAYTAAAIASICFGERVPVVDGNVARVFARRLLLEDDFRKPAAREGLAVWLQAAFDETESPGDLNQAMMELGALVCRPRNPECPCCPLRRGCAACRRGIQDAYPKKAAAGKVPVRQAVAVVLRRGTRLLLVRRAAEGLLGGLWELPGGAIESGETAAEAARRWLREQAGLEIEPQESMAATLRHAFSHFTLLLRVVKAERRGGRLKVGREGSPRWSSRAECRRLPVATAHRKILEQLGMT